MTGSGRRLTQWPIYTCVASSSLALQSVQDLITDIYRTRRLSVGLTVVLARQGLLTLDIFIVGSSLTDEG